MAIHDPKSTHQPQPAGALIRQLLWFDTNEDRTPQQKLERAIKHYTTKEFPGEMPHVCLVPARDRWWLPETINGVEVRPSPVMIISGSFMLAQVIAPESETPTESEETP